MWDLMDVMECCLCSFILFYHNLFCSVFSWVDCREKGTVNSWLHIVTLYGFVLLIDWPIVINRLVVGSSQYCQVFLGERGRRKRKGEWESEGRYRSGAVCIEFQVYVTFQTAGIITVVHRWCPLPLCFSSSLPHFTVLLSQPCCVSVCVFVAVCVCLHAWAADKA